MVLRKETGCKFFLKPDREKTNQRMCLPEHPFGTIKRAMGATYFLLKGMRKVGWGVWIALLSWDITWKETRIFLDFIK